MRWRGNRYEFGLTNRLPLKFLVLANVGTANGKVRDAIQQTLADCAQPLYLQAECNRGKHCPEIPQEVRRDIRRNHDIDNQR